MSFAGGSSSAKVDAKDIRSEFVDECEGWDGKKRTVGELRHGNGVEEVEFDRWLNGKGFDVVDRELGFGGTTVLYGIAVCVSSVEGEAECFENGAEFVIWKSSFEAVACVFGGTVSYGFGEVDKLVGEGVELATVFVSVDEWLGGVVRSRNSEVVDVNG